MDWYSILVLIHIFALVFWLGADIGVFVLGKFAQNPIYTVEQRMLLMKVAMIIDIFPRVSMVISFTTGYQLAVLLGALPNHLVFSFAVWLFSGFWLTIVLIGIFRQSLPLGERAKSMEKLVHFGLIPALALVSITSLIYLEPIAVPWMALKTLLYALVIVVVLLLEAAFMPAILGFVALENHGSSAEVEAQITSSMDKTYICVLMIYALVISCAVLGVVKPT